VASPAVYSSTEISLRNVAAGIVVLSLVEYLFLYLFVCFLSACFWQNKDAYPAREA